MAGRLQTLGGILRRIENMKAADYSYLALGDSYTIGEDVDFSDNFPSRLVSRIREETGMEGGRPGIIATTGWTTDELLAGIKEKNPAGPYQMVSLLIGVNNQYRGYPREQYQREFGLLLQTAIDLAGGDAGRVLVIAIPDYGCTPYGAEKAQEINADLRWYNGEAAKQAAEKGIAFADIFPESGLALYDPALTASDRLHPSGLMYAKWVEKMLPLAIEILKKQKN